MSPGGCCRLLVQAPLRAIPARSYACVRCRARWRRTSNWQLTGTRCVLGFRGPISFLVSIDTVQRASFHVAALPGRTIEHMFDGASGKGGLFLRLALSGCWALAQKLSNTKSSVFLTDFFPSEYDPYYKSPTPTGNAISEPFLDRFTKKMTISPSPEADL